VGDVEKLLTYLNSALKVLSGLDSFLRVTKKKLNFVVQCYQKFASSNPAEAVEFFGRKSPEHAFLPGRGGGGSKAVGPMSQLCGM
jgi:hypothetical protein